MLSTPTLALPRYFYHNYEGSQVSCIFYMVRGLLLSVHWYISYVCLLFPSLKLWCVYPHKISMTLKVLTQPHWWHFQGKAELNSPFSVIITELFCHCCLDEHWRLVTSLKTRFKKLICTKEIKKIIYNKLVLKNTKITSVTSVMPTTWDIYTCRESSSSVVCTAVLHPDEQTAAVSHTDRRCVQNIHMLNTAVVFAHINAGYNSFCFD